MELLMSSNGIMDMIDLYRGEAPSRSGLAKGFAENSGKYYTPQKSFARHIAQGGSMDSETRGLIFQLRDLFPMYQYIFDLWFFEGKTKVGWLYDMVGDYHVKLAGEYLDIPPTLT